MRLTIAKKIFGIAFIVLILMVTVAVYSIKLTARISDELTIVTMVHMPLAESVSQINLSILEQGLMLQRLFVLVEEENLQKQVEKNLSIYDELGILIAVEFDIINDLIALEANNANLKKTISTIDIHYENFHEQAQLLLTVREIGDKETFDILLPELNEHQDAIDQEIAVFSAHLEDLADRAVIRTQVEEKNLLQMNTILTVSATILAIGFSLIVTKLMVRSVKNLVRGTEELQSGNLDVEVAVSTNDEMATLTTSFNDMVGELRVKERIKDTFGKYLDPRIVLHLLEEKEQFNEGGQRREMTVVFIDLKGFTSISEVLEPDSLVRMINSFFSHMTQAIANNNGVVDKFMGDCVMAYWGEPFCKADEHALLACRAANDALKCLEDFRRDARKEMEGQKGAADLEIDLRIGISTGDMIVGPIGSHASKSFTVMGDPVNLGARLEGANKAYGTHVILSDRTNELVQGVVQTRELDLIRVKGKTVPTKIYELVSVENMEDQKTLPASDKFSAALSAYRAQRWELAERAFGEYIGEVPDDTVAPVYLDRIAVLKAENLPEDWDGVWNFETK